MNKQRKGKTMRKRERYLEAQGNVVKTRRASMAVMCFASSVCQTVSLPLCYSTMMLLLALTPSKKETHSQLDTLAHLQIKSSLDVNRKTNACVCVCTHVCISKKTTLEQHTMHRGQSGWSVRRKGRYWEKMSLKRRRSI